MAAKIQIVKKRSRNNNFLVMRSFMHYSLIHYSGNPELIITLLFASGIVRLSIFSAIRF